MGSLIYAIRMNHDGLVQSRISKKSTLAIDTVLH